jgi:chromosome segregation ATPase
MNVFPQSVTLQMAFLTCCHDGCAVTFGMPEHMEQQRRKDHAAFYCPNGHRQYFTGKSEAEKLKEQLAQAEKEKQLLIKKKEWAEQGRQLAQHDAKVARSHAKRAVTISRKLRQRLKTGQCPCCELKFDNLEEHMTKEHPRYR